MEHHLNPSSCSHFPLGIAITSAAFPSQNRERFLIPFLALQVIDFLLSLLTMFSSYIQVPVIISVSSSLGQTVGDSSISALGVGDSPSSLWGVGDSPSFSWGLPGAGECMECRMGSLPGVVLHGSV